MMNTSDETTKRWWSPTRYVTAIQPANATAAWPDGRPPRSGVPRPVHAFVAMTRRTTRKSATSVSVGRRVPHPVENVRAARAARVLEDEEANAEAR